MQKQKGKCPNGEMVAEGACYKKNFVSYFPRYSYLMCVLRIGNILTIRAVVRMRQSVFLRTEAEATKVQVDSTNTEGYTALHYACWQGHQKVAKLLKEAKADPRARYGEMVSPKLSL